VTHYVDTVQMDVHNTAVNVTAAGVCRDITETHVIVDVQTVSMDVHSTIVYVTAADVCPGFGATHARALTGAHTVHTDVGRRLGCATQAGVCWGDGERTHVTRLVPTATMVVLKTRVCVTLAAVVRDGGAISATRDVRTVTMDVCRTLESATLAGVPRDIGEMTAHHTVTVLLVNVDRVTVYATLAVGSSSSFGETHVKHIARVVLMDVDKVTACVMTGAVLRGGGERHVHLAVQKSPRTVTPDVRRMMGRVTHAQ
jgi:hypothetical protein